MFNDLFGDNDKNETTLISLLSVFNEYNKTNLEHQKKMNELLRSFISSTDDLMNYMKSLKSVDSKEKEEPKKEPKDFPKEFLEIHEILFLDVFTASANTMTQVYQYKENEESCETTVQNMIQNKRNLFELFDLDKVRTELLQHCGFIPLVKIAGKLQCISEESQYRRNKMLCVPLWFFKLLPEDYELYTNNIELGNPESENNFVKKKVKDINDDTRKGCVYAFIERDDIIING